MLQTIKTYFIKEKQNALVENLPAEPLDLVELGVCSVKFECMEGDCVECPGRNVISDLCQSHNIISVSKKIR